MSSGIYTQISPGQANPSTGGLTQGLIAAFGEADVAMPVPSYQTDFVYGILYQTDQYVYGAGSSISTANSLASAASGTAADGYARIQAHNVCRYRPGQGALLRFTAIFDTAIDNNLQRVGAFNQISGFMFGYNGATFGIFQVESGEVEIKLLTITVASTTNENITVTLAGVPTLVAVTNSGSTTKTAEEIARGNYSQAAGGWRAQNTGSTVYFVRNIPGVTAGAFSITATTAVGNFTTVLAGANSSTVFYPQTNWNVDRMDGSGPSGQILNPQRGNVYQIQYQYLGFGAAFMFIENSKTGGFQLVHVVQNANQRTAVNIQNPNTYLTWESRNTGSTTSKTIKAASGATFTEGIVVPSGPTAAAISEKSIVATTLTPMLSVRANLVYNNKASFIGLFMKSLSVAADGNRAVEIYIYINATLTGSTFVNVPGTAAAASNTETALTGGRLIASFIIAKNTGLVYNLADLNIVVEPGDVITVAAFSTLANTFNASLSWIQDS